MKPSFVNKFTEIRKGLNQEINEVQTRVQVTGSTNEALTFRSVQVKVGHVTPFGAPVLEAAILPAVCRTPVVDSGPGRKAALSQTEFWQVGSCLQLSCPARHC